MGLQQRERRRSAAFDSIPGLGQLTNTTLSQSICSSAGIVSFCRSSVGKIAKAQAMLKPRIGCGRPYLS